MHEIEFPNEVIQKAVYAAIGCTDTRKVESASKQITRFVLSALDDADLVVVPKEPTTAMVVAAAKEMMSWRTTWFGFPVKRVPLAWKAMWGRAPRKRAQGL